jgi:hypothetical protein
MHAALTKATAATGHGGIQVTTGEEGFFGASSPYINADPSGIPSNVESSGRYWSAKVRKGAKALLCWGQSGEERPPRAMWVAFTGRPGLCGAECAAID